MGKRSGIYDPAELGKVQAAFDLALEKLRASGTADCESDRVRARLARFALGVSGARSATSQAIAERAFKEFTVQQAFINERARR